MTIPGAISEPEPTGGVKVPSFLVFGLPDRRHPMITGLFPSPDFLVSISLRMHIIPALEL